ncbi:MAG: hypothetical protein KGL35_28270 [Bradyrhizobium sp.]|nr:hypothetical protein [Bradyrhizobium sp.]
MPSPDVNVLIPLLADMGFDPPFDLLLVEPDMFDGGVDRSVADPARSVVAATLRELGEAADRIKLMWGLVRRG